MAKKARPEPVENKRRQIRFRPDENSLLECRFTDGGAHKVGLLYEESAGGCSGVFLADPLFRVDVPVAVVPGKLARLFAEIKWVKEVHPRVVRVGFRYLE